ncbi:indoleamine 2,3-dioxygenase family protein [Coccidioides immitis RMSCC 3703]|uniref:Indoleamine 2,3-dioxygenase n=1 Tax=Coccidioides immitis RMSCC 3703 TaxID=454286 RepID=A0A0J8QWV1_COCIT|nr:indoleamine 2,3-dioxygenase family protein [Coccidioides immitis RMSCC 3703]
MLPPVPKLSDYGIDPEYGFLPSEPPLARLSDYYSPWEHVIENLQSLVLSGRLWDTVRRMPTLSTDHLHTPPEWRRAYVVLVFMLHAYIWSGDKPQERIPPPLTIPLLEVSEHLELPPVATYAGVCLWNYRPIFPDEPSHDLENLSTLCTLTGSMDEQWFYLISVAIESRGACTLPLMLDAISAVRAGDTKQVMESLNRFAEVVDEINVLLQRMYRHCDPHVFYHRIRPLLAGNARLHARPAQAVSNTTASGGEHREYVEEEPDQPGTDDASNAAVAMIKALRTNHITMVSRYIIVKSRERNTGTRPLAAGAPALNLATASTEGRGSGSKKLRGTGGTALIPFLKQARDETGEAAIGAWGKQVLDSKRPEVAKVIELPKVGETIEGRVEILGLAGTWSMEESEGGLCHW